MTFLLRILMVFLSSLLAKLEFTGQRLPSHETHPEHTLTCPACGSTKIVKNGSVRQRQKLKCKDCNRQFIENPKNKTVSIAQKTLIDKLLLERISLRGIQRVTGVSWAFLQNYVNEKFRQTPRQVKVSEKSKGRLTIECDEFWSFVGSKNNVLYIWLAIDRNTREIVGCFIGDRTRKSARKLWESIPEVYRQYAVAYTDFWQSYQKVIPSKRHRPVGKETGQTNHVERLNNTLRHRISRLVRKNLAFSKKLENHIGAVWYFIHHYNAELASA